MQDTSDRLRACLILASTLLAAAPLLAAEPAAPRASSVAITDEQIDRLIGEAPARSLAPTAASEKVRGGLCAHVREMTRL
jgi:hypothetical protein